jgi:hypothetical protein
MAIAFVLIVKIARASSSDRTDARAFAATSKRANSRSTCCRNAYALSGGDVSSVPDLAGARPGVPRGSSTDGSET